MRNPIPEIALPYLLDYLLVLRERLLTPSNGVDGVLSADVAERTGISKSYASTIAVALHQHDFTESVVRYFPTGLLGWWRLTAKGFLWTDILERERLTGNP